MQSTGQTSTHAVSLVPMHGSQITYAILFMIVHAWQATGSPRPQLVEGCDPVRAALSRLYGGRRPRVARGWRRRGDVFESVTLISPYPDASLSRLNPGTMVI